MKTLRFAALAVVSLFAFSACTTTKDLEANSAASQQWIAAQSRTKPAAVFAGNWVSTDWGGAALSQRGRKIEGVMGGYNVSGVVSGSRAYLLIQHDAKTHYTMILRRGEGNTLVGAYSDRVPFDVNVAQLAEFSAF